MRVHIMSLRMQLVRHGYNFKVDQIFKIPDVFKPFSVFSFAFIMLKQQHTRIILFEEFFLIGSFNLLSWSLVILAIEAAPVFNCSFDRSSFSLLRNSIISIRGPEQISFHLITAHTWHRLQGSSTFYQRWIR